MIRHLRRLRLWLHRHDFADWGLDALDSGDRTRDALRRITTAVRNDRQRRELSRGIQQTADKWSRRYSSLTVRDK